MNRQMWHLETLPVGKHFGRPCLPLAASPRKEVATKQQGVDKQIDRLLQRVRPGNEQPQASKQAKPQQQNKQSTGPVSKPIAASPQQQEQPSQFKAKAAPQTKHQSSRRVPQTGTLVQKDDTDEKLDDITASELDKLFEQVERDIKANGVNIWDDDADSQDDSNHEQSKETPVTAAGSFKGFGAPPRELQNTARRQQSSSLQQANVKTSTTSKQPAVPPLRIFLYAADAKQTQSALQQAGWQHKVVISEDLKSAHAVVSAKSAQGGRHNKLQQGERTARNAGIPFVCVGRRITKDNVVLSLAPILSSHMAQHGIVDGRALRAAVKAAGVSEEMIEQREAVASGKLKPGWKQRMLESYGLPTSASVGNLDQTVGSSNENATSPDGSSLEESSKERVLAGV